MTPTERRVDWNGVKECLIVLHLHSSEFLKRSLLIGGAASWFYRVQLQKAGDPEFRDFPETSDAEEIWLSKDIDFTGIFRADAWEMLPALIESDSSGNRMLKVNGVRIGFAQVGVTFDPQEAFTRARVGQFINGSDVLQFLVMDPVTLYREKQALSLKRNQKNDRLHFQTLSAYLHWEFCSLAQKYAQADFRDLAEEQEALGTMLDIKNRCVEIIQNSAVRARIQNLPTGKNEKASFLIRLLDLEA
jgi:hypothetical protein